MIGFIYFIVIIFANTIGAISGMGGGVIIKPVLDFIQIDTVAVVSFYSTVAVFTMSIVSTWRQVKSGVRLAWGMLAWISAGAVIGGILGNLTFEYLLHFFASDTGVKLVQIVLTIVTLLFAFLYSKYDWTSFRLDHFSWYLLCGLLLGFLASLLGIGGGPINVSLFMLLFGMRIKDATIYSIATIFFSQLSKLVTIAFTTGFARYDLSLLFYVVAAAILGGLLGAKLNHLLSDKKVTIVFQSVILFVLVINMYNGWQLLR